MCACAVIKWFPQVILKGQGSMQEIGVCRDRDSAHREGKRREEHDPYPRKLNMSSIKF